MNTLPLILAAALSTAKPVTVVTTTFPIYDWTREAIGDSTNRVELVLLQKSGADLHNYTPTAADLRTISECDLFIYNGGESDGWTSRALAQKANPKRRELSLLAALGDAVKDEEIREEMEHHHHDGHEEHDEHCGHDEHDEHHHHHDHAGIVKEKDEHVWLSLRHAKALVGSIADSLGDVDPANAAAYSKNARAYTERLAALDREYSDAVAHSRRRTILVADRFPFRYLTDDYGLEWHAAFTGCSAESEASFKTIMTLAKKVNNLGLPVILTMEGANHKIAETVRRTTRRKNQRILSLDSMQSVTVDRAEREHYIDVMRRNLKVLKQALN
ncbi:MAG: metal ABC transporter substrate-binding protein [Kiritimatiellae bacterium]|nr:metal ABC transporter substrate-binding protein [Kiritimatiellia bacterium]